MKELIRKKLNEIEEEFQVRILYAVESGSRAWGFCSKDSDFDVRFIYIHRPNWYLAIGPQGFGAKRDIIELPFNGLLDISGWEITKALRLFRKSNPTLMEWLRSDMLYHENSSFIARLRTLETEVFNPAAGLHHYLNMAKNNYRKYLQASEIKNCLYAIRSVLACKWIEKNKTPPPIRLSELLEELIPAGRLKRAIEQLINLKIAGNELETEPRNSIITDYIARELSSIEISIQNINFMGINPTEKLDALFRDILKEVNH